MTPFLADPDVTIWHGDALEVLRALPSSSVDAVVTSPPYLDARPEYPSPSPGQFGLIFGELRRVASGPMLLNVGRLWRDGTEQLWWTVLLNAACINDWDLLDTLVWLKPNANPIHGAVLTSSHEYVLILGTPGEALNVDAIRTEYAASSIPRMSRTWRNGRGVKGDDREDQDGRDVHPLGARPRSYIEVCVGREKGNPHPAPMPLELAEHLVKLAALPGQTVLDPFCGSGTTLLAARRLGRHSAGIDSSADYCQLAARRLQQLSLLVEPGAA